MTNTPRAQSGLAPVDQTLTRVVLLMRLLGWAWLVILSLVAIGADDEVNVGILVGAMVVATAGTGVTFLAARRDFLDEGWYVIFDGAVTLLLSTSGWLAGYGEFVTGGYPASWLFIVAYATNLTFTTVAGIAASLVFAFLHTLMDLDITRSVGSLQFIVFAVVVGWAFDALRERERLRIEAEDERAEAQRDLMAEQAKTSRLEERSVIARQLHDSVLQTLTLISSSADDASEVRYLTRVQERDLRRTINEYQSPFGNSFRARLLDARADVEDRFRVEIEQVVKDDAEMDSRLEAVVAAAAEAMVNAARHSGSPDIDLFSEILAGIVHVSVRDRGKGFDPVIARGGVTHSIIERVDAVGGTTEIKMVPGGGTDVRITVPLR